ncbi:rRNA processing protein [Grosmannia clavigera kw1407]|uniref:Pre-rRNA-processing protein PNO1 n=1 Tax=Grosmannia clavigera (strain kw1407 / UAMH 11150) TaxID=655863 RepID=F0XPF2_GROCL|nr:rRNA processing protein [Grosmannia clavigera kw1407]EFX00280.1 rRNA processing protein [Grosmannia clavigera kw1407]
MPAPTAVKKDETASPAVQVPVTMDHEDDVALDAVPGVTLVALADDPATATVVSFDSDPDVNMDIDEESRPRFAAAKDVQTAVRRESRKIPIPPHRMTPLKATWSKIYTPLVENLRLQVRMNIKSKAVELRTSRSTVETGAIQKGEDFVRAYAMGFDVEDAVAILRLDGIFIQSFEIKDVKSLEGDHLARAVGRIVGKDGRTKYAIENTTKTRIVVAGGSKIHILGGFKEIGMARESVVSLILGKPPSKVYGNLRSISTRMKERF